MSVSLAASPVAAGSCSTGPATTTLPLDCTTTPRASSTALPPLATFTRGHAGRAEAGVDACRPAVKRVTAIIWSAPSATQPGGVQAVGRVEGGAQEAGRAATATGARSARRRSGGCAAGAGARPGGRSRGRACLVGRRTPATSKGGQRRRMRQPYLRGGHGRKLAMPNSMCKGCLKVGQDRAPRRRATPVGPMWVPSSPNSSGWAAPVLVPVDEDGVGPPASRRRPAWRCWAPPRPGAPSR